MNINLTLIGQTIVFAVFVWFCMRYIWPPVVEAMQQRKSKIEEGLLAATRGLSAEKDANERAGELLSEAKTQATHIIAKANQQSDAMVEAAKVVAVEEAEKIKEQGQSQLDQELRRAKSELQAELSTLVMAGVRAIVKREVDEERHAKLIDEMRGSL